MPLTRSKRKMIGEDQTHTEIKLLELVNHNKNRKIGVSRRNSETIKRNTNEIQNSQQIRVSLSLTQINASQISSQASATSEEVITMLRKVRKVLDQNFKNVSERLELDFIPQCLYDVKSCNQFHNPKSPIKKTSINDSYIAQTYLSEERHFQFFHFVRHNLCGFEHFPGSEICLKILEEILKYKSSVISQFSTNYIVSELYSVFLTIIQKFPPCGLRQEYLNLFSIGIQIDGIGNKRNQILPSILDLLHDQIFTKEDIFEKKLSTRLTTRDDFTKNFYVWDVEHQQISSFSNLPREDRIERLFLILDLLVRILEQDLAIFMIKYSHKYGLNSLNGIHRPLICSAIWKNYESFIVVNDLTKKITSIFVSMNEMNYPSDKIQIISRLLSLIGHVINMYEYTDVKIEYPQYKNYSIDLSREIQKSVESSSHYSIDLHLKVIKNLRSALLRLLLTHHLLTKIIGLNQPISLTIPLNAIYNRQFEQYDDFEGKENSFKTEKYPLHITKKNVIKSKITKGNYLKLMLLYTESMNSYYRLQSCAAEIKKNEDQLLTQAKNSPQTSSITSTKSFDMKIFLNELKNIDFNEKILLRNVDINYFNAIHIQLTKEFCIFYRNEIKNFLVLCKLIPRLRDQLGSSYHDWMSFIDKMQV